MSALGASPQSPTRFFRSKALARRAVESSSLETTVFAPSIVYTPGDPWITLLDRMSHLPVVPLAGSGRTLFQPIWAEDVADTIVAALDLPADGDGGHSFDLAGPESLSYEQIVRAVLRSLDRDRPLLKLPMPLAQRSLDALERIVGPTVFATAEEVELMDEPMTSKRGTADAESLGVTPLRLSAVLG